MEIEKLAHSFLDLKIRSEEKRRFIDYDLPKLLKELEKNQDTVEERLKIIEFNNNISTHNETYFQLISQKRKVEDELKPLLVQLKVTRKDPFRTHVNDRTYFDTFISEDGDIISPGHYTLIN